MRSKFTLKTTLQQSNTGNNGCQGECLGGQLLNKTPQKLRWTKLENLFTNASIRDRPEDSKRMLETISKKLAVCWKSEGYQKTAPSKIFAGQIWQPLTTQKEIAIERNSDRNTTITPLTTAFWLSKGALTTNMEAAISLSKRDTIRTENLTPTIPDLNINIIGASA